MNTNRLDLGREAGWGGGMTQFLRRLSQEDSEFKACLNYRESSKTSQVT